MKRHINYLKYILRHKYFVFKAGRLLGCGRWQLLTHDLSKLLPSEWFAYASAFYMKNGDKCYTESEAFNLAWLKHQHRNPHHWQYWLLKMDRGDVVPMPMPKKYALEMLADWAGAGRAVTGRWEVGEWYRKNADKIILHPDTKAFVTTLLEPECTWKWINIMEGK